MGDLRDIGKETLLGCVINDLIFLRYHNLTPAPLEKGKVTICSCVGRLRWTNVSHAPHFRFFHHNLSRILKEEFSKMKS